MTIDCIKKQQTEKWQANSVPLSHLKYYEVLLLHIADLLLARLFVCTAAGVAHSQEIWPKYL